MRKKLNNTAETHKYLNSLPKIYLVGCWAKYGVREYPLACWRKTGNDMLPLVYDYYDFNGMCDEYHLYDIRQVTTGTIICWTVNEKIANMLADSLNKSRGK